MGRTRPTAPPALQGPRRRAGQRPTPWAPGTPAGRADPPTGPDQSRRRAAATGPRLRTRVARRVPGRAEPSGRRGRRGPGQGACAASGPGGSVVAAPPPRDALPVCCWRKERKESARTVAVQPLPPAAPPCRSRGAPVAAPPRPPPPASASSVRAASGRGGGPGGPPDPGPGRGSPGAGLV